MVIHVLRTFVDMCGDKNGFSVDKIKDIVVLCHLWKVTHYYDYVVVMCHL